MSQDIGNPVVGSMLGHVESQAGHHRRHPRGPHPGRGRRAPTASPRAGSPSSSPATTPRARPPSSPDPDDPRPHRAPSTRRTVDLILQLREQLADRRPGRRPRHHRLAPGQHHHGAGLEVDHQPPPGPRRAGDPRTEEETQVLLHPVRSHDAQRDLAVRLHPLPAHRPDRAPGADVEIISWLDDCTRYALHVTAHPRITGPIVTATFRKTATHTASQPPP